MAKATFAGFSGRSLSHQVDQGSDGLGIGADEGLERSLRMLAVSFLRRPGHPVAPKTME
jgi:hypothetical protein